MEHLKMDCFWDNRCWNLVAAFVKNALNLNDLAARFITSPKDVQIPALRNLKRLKLDFWNYDSWGLLPVFLNSAPNLEELTLEDRCRGSKTDVPICLQSLQLKTVTFKGHKS